MSRIIFQRLIWGLAFFLLTVVANDESNGQGRDGRPLVSAIAAPVQEVLKTVAPTSNVLPISPRTPVYSLGINSRRYPVRVEPIAWQSASLPSRISAIAYYPANPERPCPVVVYSHGLGTNPQDYDYLAREWASVGFVAILLRHPGSDEAAWRGRGRPMSELKSLYQKYWNGRDRAEAIRFVVEQLSTRPQPFGFAASMDVSKIGVAGNDLGALGALLVAGQLPPDNRPSLKDDRVSAVLALSPPVYCSPSQAPLVYYDVYAPFMSFAGTNDDGVVGMTKASQRRIPFDSLSQNDRFHITLNGADHLVYSGHRRPVRQADDPKYQQTIAEVSTLFWLAYLMEDGDSILRLRSIPSALPGYAGVLERRQAKRNDATVPVQTAGLPDSEHIDR